MTSRPSALHSRWAALSPRERRGLVLAAAAVLLLLVWQVGIRPAWNVLASADARRAQAWAQAETMQALAAEAQVLQAATAGVASNSPVGRPGALEPADRDALLQLLGPGAEAEVAARVVTLHFDEAQAEGLRLALRTARSRLQLKLIQAEIVPGQQGLKGTLKLEWPAS